MLELLFVGPIVMCVIASTLVFGGAAIWHELQWRRRLRDSVIVQGRIIGIADGDVYDHAVVEYNHDGSTIQFESSYGSTIIRVGASVRVAYNPNTGEAELLTLGTRYLLTLGLGLFGFGPWIYLAWCAFS